MKNAGRIAELETLLASHVSKIGETSGTRRFRRPLLEKREKWRTPIISLKSQETLLY
jgi:hypothetical protein